MSERIIEIFIGPNGCGKTHELAKRLKALMDRNWITYRHEKAKLSKKLRENDNEVSELFKSAGAVRDSRSMLDRLFGMNKNAENVITVGPGVDIVKFLHDLAKLKDKRDAINWSLVYLQKPNATRHAAHIHDVEDIPYMAGPKAYQNRNVSNQGGGKGKSSRSRCSLTFIITWGKIVELVGVNERDPHALRLKIESYFKKVSDGVLEDIRDCGGHHRKFDLEFRNCLNGGNWGNVVHGLDRNYILTLSNFDARPPTSTDVKCFLPFLKLMMRDSKVLCLDKPFIGVHPHLVETLTERLIKLIESEKAYENISMHISTQNPSMITERTLKYVKRYAEIKSITEDTSSSSLTHGFIPLVLDPSKKESRKSVPWTLVKPMREALFSKHAVFVEGITDYRFYGTLFRSDLGKRYNLQGVHVINAGGGHNISVMLKMLGHVKGAIGIHDNDVKRLSEYQKFLDSKNVPTSSETLASSETHGKLITLKMVAKLQKSETDRWGEPFISNQPHAPILVLPYLLPRVEALLGGDILYDNLKARGELQISTMDNFITELESFKKDEDVERVMKIPMIEAEFLLHHLKKILKKVADMLEIP